jgi:hypothetical protein
MGLHRGPTVVTNGLVLYLDAANPKSYPKSGTMWNDLSGNNNNGTLINGPTFDSGNAGSIVFDGVNDYVESTPIQPTFFTLSSWFKATGPASQTGGGYLIARPTFTISYGLGYDWDTERVLFIVASNSNLLSVSNILRNTIYNVVGVYNGQQRLVYINGYLTASQNWSQNPNVSSSTSTQIGRLGYSDFQRFFNGNIFQTSIYNRALSAEEILQNYNATKGRFNL